MAEENLHKLQFKSLRVEFLELLFRIRWSWMECSHFVLFVTLFAT